MPSRMPFFSKSAIVIEFELLTLNYVSGIGK